MLHFTKIIVIYNLLTGKLFPNMPANNVNRKNPRLLSRQPAASGPLTNPTRPKITDSRILTSCITHPYRKTIIQTHPSREGGNLAGESQNGG